MRLRVEVRAGRGRTMESNCLGHKNQEGRNCGRLLASVSVEARRRLLHGLTLAALNRPCGLPEARATTDPY